LLPSDFIRQDLQDDQDFFVCISNFRLVKRDAGRKLSFFNFWHGFHGWHGLWFFVVALTIQAPELLVRSTRQRRINPPEGEESIFIPLANFPFQEVPSMSLCNGGRCYLLTLLDRIDPAMRGAGMDLQDIFFFGTDFTDYTVFLLLK